VTVDGDTLHGTSKAGRLPSSKVLITVLGVALWAMMMLCTGLVATFMLLLIARLGAGEAGVAAGVPRRGQLSGAVDTVRVHVCGG
jgi:hypothetical protein